jgi:hypothetical protein
MRPAPAELAKAFQQHDRKIERELRRDRGKLFRALEEFTAMRGDKEAWEHFQKRWPEFFPELEYEKVASNEVPSIAEFPYWLDQIWMGGETDPYLGIMLGIRPTPKPEELNPEESGAIRLSSIPPALFQLDWQTGSTRYHGGCDFQRALYLLYRESWRAKVCEVCEATFIAKRAAQKYCSTDCSESVQRQVKRQWWQEHGEEWRKERTTSKAKPKGGKNGTHKTR